MGLRPVGVYPGLWPVGSLPGAAAAVGYRPVGFHPGASEAGEWRPVGFHPGPGSWLAVSWELPSAVAWELVSGSDSLLVLCMDVGVAPVWPVRWAGDLRGSA